MPKLGDAFVVWRMGKMHGCLAAFPRSTAGLELKSLEHLGEAALLLKRLPPAVQPPCNGPEVTEGTPLQSCLAALARNCPVTHFPDWPKTAGFE